MITEPHRLTLLDAQAFLDQSVLVVASAVTADRTQRKRLFAQGGQFFVERRYLSAGEEGPPDIVFKGGDLAQAVRAYNLLS